MKNFFKNLKDNRFLPFIIIAFIAVLLIVINILTSHADRVYDKSDITFYFDAEGENISTETNYVEGTEAEEVYTEDTESDYVEEDNTLDEKETDAPTSSGDDLDLDDEPETEPKLFATKEFLENTALAFLNKTTRYKKYFASDDLFNSYDIYLNDPKIVSSDLKKNTVILSGYPDGDGNERVTLTVQLVVEDNKVVDVVAK